MSALTQNPAEQLQQAATALAAVQKALDYALADLKQRSQKADGKISAALLDQHQLISYDLAFIYCGSYWSAFCSRLRRSRPRRP